MNFSDRELEHYARHIMLNEIGLDGQRKLAKASVAVIGAGGLGCPAASYLASAGLAQLTIIDDDIVEAANLQRQLLYGKDDLGKPKAAAAAAKLATYSLDTRIDSCPSRADESNIDRLISGFSAVLDASDNFATRHIVNRACQSAAIPLISGSAERLDGQLAVFNFAAAAQPCYACLYPPASGQAASQDAPCATLGVFAPLTGTIGSLMASEAIKIIASDAAETLASKMLAVDLATMRFRLISLKASPSCPVCTSGNQ